MLRLVERDIDLGEDGRYVVRVAGPADEIGAEVRRFIFSLTVTFGLLGIALGLTTLLQIRFGLGPLTKLRSALSAIRRGEAERIPGDYPRDIAPLAQELNLLLDTNREILDRARTQVGNLAHALKTPLSVIVNEVGTAPDEVAARVREQARIMRDQVNYHLDRARAAALAGTLGTITEVEPVVAGLVRTFERIYRDKGRGDRGGDPGRHALSRRAAGPRGDDRQPDRQRLQMGRRPHRDFGRYRARERARLAAHPHRRRRAWDSGRRAGGGAQARPASRRDEARLRPRPLDRARSRRALPGHADARALAARRIRAVLELPGDGG